MANTLSVNPTPVDDRLAYGVEEAGRLLGIGRSLAYELVLSGRLASVKAGKRRLVPRSAIDAFLAGA